MARFIKTDLAWAAGIFDGEGCVGIYALPDGNHAMRISCAQKTPAALYRLQEMFGGSVTDQRDCKVWGICGAKAFVFMEAIRPYSIVKASQIDVAIEFQLRRSTSLFVKLTPQQRRRDQVSARKLKELKRG